MRMTMEETRVVWITGGSRGIGRALVQRFKREGFQVATCSTTIESARASEADLSFACDVSQEDQIERGVREIVKVFGRIDVLVNNAAIAGANSLSLQENDDLWYRIIDVNLHGTYRVTRHALPHLVDDGCILNISSTLGLRGVPDQSAYCAAKHGVIGFTRALALQLAGRGVRVNAICPGWVRTDMATMRASELGATTAALAEGVPTGRLVEPDEVADLALFLASSAGKSITGQALTIDGGSLA